MQLPNSFDKNQVFIQTGLVELNNWLRDLIRQGFAAIYDAPSSYWTDMAAKMVDSKLPSIGRRIRQIPILLTQNDWHQSLLLLLGELYLLTSSFRHFEQLPLGLQHELLSQLGTTIQKKQIRAAVSPTSDTWIVMGQSFGEEEQLSYRRVWLLGIQTEKVALVLDFSWNNQPYDSEWVVGTAFEGSLYFYPSSFPQRAVVGTLEFIDTAVYYESGFANFDVFLQQHSKNLAKQPWLFLNGILLDEVIPYTSPDKNFFLVDTKDNLLPLVDHPTNNWQLLALSGGHPIRIFGEWHHQLFTPLSVLTDERIISL